nr:hypothetical protein [Armatimonas sp.]
MTALEIVATGEELYNAKIRELLETEANHGKFVVLDILTGDFELDAEFAQLAANRLRERQPQATIFGLQIGVDSAYIVGLPRIPPPESSSTEVQSYKDYERELPKLLENLSPLACVRFGLSCVDALTELARESIDAEVSQEHQGLYLTIREEIECGLKLDQLLPTDRAEMLGTELLDNIMGNDTDTWIDVDSLISRWVLVLHYVLEYCQKRDNEILEALAIEVINTLDYLYEAELATMFTLPEFRAEWERQQRAALS